MEESCLVELSCKKCGAEVTFSYEDSVQSKFYKCPNCGIIDQTKVHSSPTTKKELLDIVKQPEHPDVTKAKEDDRKKLLEEKGKKTCGTCRFFRNVNLCPKVVGYSPQQKSGDGEYRIIDLLCMPHEAACKVFQPKKKRANSTGPDMGEILTLLNEKFIFKCPTDTRELFGYNNGQYIPFEHRVHEVLESKYGEELSSHFVEETIKHLQRANYVEREEVNKFINKVPIQNGLFNLVTHDVERFNPEEIYTYKLNVKYDPEAKCPIFLKFINQILEPEDIPLLQEIMGYCLLPAMPFHKLFWWYGIGRNGKDRIILTLEHILEKKNCSELSIGEFNEKRRFSLYQLYGKLLNVSSEPFLSKYGLQTNVLKMISGQNTIRAELKGKNKRIQFTNIAKPIIIGNRFPKVEDSTVGWWDRCVVLNFPKSFIGKDVILDIEKTWLDNPEEVSGIFNWMLEGLYRLKENNVFSTSKNTEETKAEFMRVSDPFRAWLNDCCVLITDGKVTRDDAYNSYKDYSDELGATPDNPRKFYVKMRNTPKIKEYRTIVDGKTERGFQGITIKTEEQREEDGSQKSLMSSMSRMSSSTTRESLENNNKKDINKGVWKPDNSDILDIKPTKTTTTEEKKPVETPVSETGDNGGFFIKCFDCGVTLGKHEVYSYGGHRFCRKCRLKIEDQKKKEAS